MQRLRFVLPRVFALALLAWTCVISPYATAALEAEAPGETAPCSDCPEEEGDCSPFCPDCVCHVGGRWAPSAPSLLLAAMPRERAVPRLAVREQPSMHPDEPALDGLFRPPRA